MVCATVSAFLFHDSWHATCVIIINKICWGLNDEKSMYQMCVCARAQCVVVGFFFVFQRKSCDIWYDHLLVINGNIYLCALVVLHTRRWLFSVFTELIAFRFRLFAHSFIRSLYFYLSFVLFFYSFAIHGLWTLCIWSVFALWFEIWYIGNICAVAPVQGVFWILVVQ